MSSLRTSRAPTTHACNSRRGRLSKLGGAARALDITSDEWRKPSVMHHKIHVFHDKPISDHNTSK